MRTSLAVCLALALVAVAIPADTLTKRQARKLCRQQIPDCVAELLAPTTTTTTLPAAEVFLGFPFVLDIRALPPTVTVIEISIGAVDNQPIVLRRESFSVLDALGTTRYPAESAPPNPFYRSCGDDGSVVPRDGVAECLLFFTLPVGFRNGTIEFNQDGLSDSTSLVL